MSEQPENTTADDTVDAAAGTPEAKVRGERKTREGLVVSDWGAVNDRVAGLPGPVGQMPPRHPERRVAPRLRRGAPWG